MKVKEEILINEVGEDLCNYISQGIIDLSSFSKKIDPNLNIDNIDKLLRIHFVLTKSDSKNSIGVIDFIEQLPQRIRRIKTTVKKATDIFNGEVRGKINWNETIRVRNNQDPENKLLFVCDKREKNYEISENLVLKSLLYIITDIIENDLKYAFYNNYIWLDEWVKRKDLKLTLNQLFFRNVYLNVPPPKGGGVLIEVC